MKTTDIFGGMEGGGTKFVCAVGTSPGDIRARLVIPTTSPDETLKQAIAFFKEHKVNAIGLAPFGPLTLDPNSPEYGSISATPKPGWSNTNVLGYFRAAFDLPLAIDTDVNAAAFGEYTWVPEAQKLDSLVYFTIGTGIGAGFVVNGRILHGLSHPETGHILIPHDRAKDPFPGMCPFHKDCFEGLASGSAIAERWKQPASMLGEEHLAWNLETGYIAAALVNVILTTSPQRILLGGGVMKREFLFPAIRKKVRLLLNDYLRVPGLDQAFDSLIIPPALGSDSGVLGAMALAQEAMRLED